MTVFSADEIEKAIIKAGILDKVTSTKQITFYNAPLAFDIETTSFEVHSNGQVIKQAITYIWTLAIKDVIVQGRTWEEFIKVCKFMSEWYELNDKQRLVIYIHNLSYEFQFMHKWFEWTEVFSLHKRRPVRALCDLGIEFRCSYKLSGYSLTMVGEQLTKHNIRKLKGDLDYSLKRNYKTPLTEKELAYTYNDVLIITAYIEEYIERVGSIAEIPMTKTGEVRNFTRKQCFYGGGKKKENQDVYKKYRNIMKTLILTAEEYKQAKAAFAGGHTHANANYVGDVVHEVASEDFTSAYPAVMVTERFPMSAPEFIKIKDEQDFATNLEQYCCMFDVEFDDIQSTNYNENYISKSHCTKIKGLVENNGKVDSAEHIKITLTEQDFKIILDNYTWKNMIVYNFRRMKKGYLPTNLIKALLEIYKLKTELKGVDERVVEYQQSKERLNSFYGMCVTDICRPTIIYSPLEWTSETPDISEAIKKNNNSAKRFLYYLWGVWVTAYNRRNLFMAIKELGEDYVYSDTDSVKFKNFEKHKQFFETYNKINEFKLKNAMNYHKLDYDLCRPKTIKGVTKVLGAWEFEGISTRFKTLGSKRYLYEKNNELTLTVAGLNKQDALKYMQKVFGNQIFENFKEGLYIPPENTGKQTHTYIDEEMDGVLTDYLGNKAEYHEKSGIHLSNAEYTLSLSEIYLQYLLGINDEEL